MKISLFQGIVLGVFGAAALIGLFVFATYTSSNGTKAAIGTVVIWGTLPKTQMDQVLQLATRDNTDLKGVSYVQKDPATFESDITSAIAEQDPPDLVLITQEDLLALQKVLQPIPSAALSERTFSDTFAEEGELFYTADGSGAYGMPYLVDPLMLYDNRTILSSDGISSPPTTWDALTGLVPHVAVLTPSDNVSRGLIALGTYDNVTDARAILSALFLQAGAPLSTRSTDGTLSAALGNAAADNGISPGSAVLRFYTQFADPSKVSYTWNASLEDSEQAFLSGDLALYIGFASEAQYLHQANPNLDFNLSPLPQPATATSNLTYGLTYAFSIPRGAANASGALAAASALLGSSADTQAASATGLAPALRSLLGSPPSNAVAAVSYPSALYSRGWLSPPPASTDQVFSAMIGDVISGQLTLDAALASAESSLSALLQQ